MPERKPDSSANFFAPLETGGCRISPARIMTGRPGWALAQVYPGLSQASDSMANRAQRWNAGM